MQIAHDKKNGGYICPICKQGYESEQLANLCATLNPLPPCKLELRDTVWVPSALHSGFNEDTVIGIRVGPSKRGFLGSKIPADEIDKHLNNKRFLQDAVPHEWVIRVEDEHFYSTTKKTDEWEQSKLIPENALSWKSPPVEPTGSCLIEYADGPTTVVRKWKGEWWDTFCKNTRTCVRWTKIS